MRGTCKICGCTDDRACPGGCSWVNAEHTICSRCVDIAKGICSTEHKLEQECPHCLYRAEFASNTKGAHAPGEGDVSLCINCGKFSRYDTHLNLARFSDDELAALPPPIKSQMEKVKFAWEIGVKRKIKVQGVWIVEGRQ